MPGATDLFTKEAEPPYRPGENLSLEYSSSDPTNPFDSIEMTDFAQLFPDNELDMFDNPLLEQDEEEQEEANAFEEWSYGGIVRGNAPSSRYDAAYPSSPS